MSSPPISSSTGAFRIDDDGWLGDVRRCASPNRDARPLDCSVDALIVHGITLPPGHFGHGHVDALFTNRIEVGAHPAFVALVDLRVSAHLLIARTGAITQYVSFDARAWHAGVSRLAGRERVNDFGIGIELEGTDDCPYSPFQYAVLAGVTAALLQRYPALTRERIVGHSDIAPGRKTDPGPAFDWAIFNRLLDARAMR